MVLVAVRSSCLHACVRVRACVRARVSAEAKTGTDRAELPHAPVGRSVHPRRTITATCLQHVTTRLAPKRARLRPVDDVPSLRHTS